jgi:hypothetical protein
MKLRAPKFHLPSDNRGEGFALVLTLIMVVLTAVAVVAFLTTTTTERTTAAAYGRIDKADFFAQAGVDAATARLVTEMTYRPYHAIGYRVLNNGLNTEVVPVITGPRTTNPSTPTYNTAPGPDVYLVSTVDPVGTNPPGSTAPSGLTNTNSVDLNDNHLSTEARGWIGSPTTSTGILPYRASWIDILRDPTKIMQPDPSAANYNPVIGRYAYWIEDETSKLDVSQIGNIESAGAFLRGDGVDLPSNTPPKLAVNDLDLGALPLIGASPLPPGDVPTNSGIINFRANIPMSDARFLNRVGGALTPNVHETTKFYATVFGLSDDLAGNGRRRANINALVTSPSPAPSPASPVPAGIIAGNIDDIVYVISGRHLFNATPPLSPIPTPDNRVFRAAPDPSPGATPNTLINFGSRFFSSPTPTTNEQTNYLEKLAANIRDYIDADSDPTIVNNINAVPTPTPPTHSIPGGGASGPNEVIAVGKENVPFLQEYLLRVKEVTFSAKLGTSANYTIEIDHYLEFWNMTNRDISVADLGPNPFLRIANQFGWDASGATPGTDIPQSPSRDFSVPLNAFRDANGNALVFRAGVATVLTTDPTPLPSVFNITASQFFRPPAGTPANQYRVYSGATTNKSSSHLRITSQTRPALNGYDTWTELILGNTNGVIESFGAPAVDVISVNVDDGTSPLGQDSAKLWTLANNNTCAYHFRGSSLKGNATAFSPIPSQKGDPRTNNEQMSLSSLTSVNNDQTAYLNELNSTNMPHYVTLTVPNSTFVDCTTWPDPSNNTADQNNAPAVIANGALTSIGQLGNIFDPARVIGPLPNGAGDVHYSRGGGRTLKIGQADDLITGARFSPTWFNAAWRLTDLFAARPVSNLAQPPQQSEMVATPTSRGKININGVLRDSVDSSGNLLRSGGVAFRTALRNFNFRSSPDSDPALNGRALSSTEIDSLVGNIQDYLTTNGPIMERGEISQLPFFNSGSMTTVNDRGREEIFRRTVEMTTTRSASFTVYAIGEAIRQDKGGTKTTVGQKRLAITFQLEPQVGGAPLQSSILPYDAADSYRVRKIYAPN